MKFFRRIESKLLFSFLALAIVPLIVMAFISYTTGIRTVKQQTFENLGLVADSIKSHTYTFLTSQKNIAKDFSSDRQIIEYFKSFEISGSTNPETFEALERHILLNKLPLYSPSLLDVTLLDHTGKIVYSSVPGKIGMDESFKDYFIKVRNEGYFGKMHYSKEFGEAIFEVSAPVIDNESSSLLGIVVNKVSGTTLVNVTRSRWLEKHGIAELSVVGSYFFGKKTKDKVKKQNDNSGDVYIVNENKHAITLPKWATSGILEFVVDTEPVRNALENGKEMLGIYNDYRGVSIIGASTFIEEVNWVVLIEKDLDHTFALLFKLKAQMVTFTIIILGVIIFASTRFSKNFTAPLKLLLKATKMQSAGHSSYRIENIANDEFGILEKSFNKMFDDIQKITISRNFFERVLKGMSDSVIVTDLNFKIKLVNPTTLNLLGYSEDELIDRSFFTLFFEGNILLNLRNLITTRLIKTGSVFIAKNHNAIYKTKGGHGIDVNFSSFFTKDCRHKEHISDCDLLEKLQSCLNCKEIRIVNIAHDITQHKMTEAKLNEAKEAAEYSASVRIQFLANMSHELRTPLNTILGMTEVLQDGVYGDLNEKQTKSLRSIDSGGRHLLELINDILDVSKIEAGMMKIEITTTSVKAVCDASMLFVKQMAKNKNIKVKTRIDENVVKVQADELRMKQILVNLLSNAVKFTNEGGMVGLDVIGKPDEKKIYFVVHDNGIGIKKDEIGKLFEPFTQVGGVANNSHAGTGLGLSLVKQMVELHGGKVFVESEYGNGSKFSIVLPWENRGESVEVKNSEFKDKNPEANETERTVINEEALSFANGKRPLILIADDNSNNINVFSSYLSAKGFEIIVAGNGIEAIALVKERNPNVVLMDIQMPVMDGIEATRRLRADESLKGLIIIGITASGQVGNKEICLKAGVDEFMTKPVELKRLVSIINKKIDVLNS